MYGVAFILAWIRAAVTKLFAVSSSDPPPVEARPLSEIPRVDPEALTERDRTLVHINRLAERLSEPLLELARDESYSVEPHIEELGSKKPDYLSGSTEVIDDDDDGDEEIDGQFENHVRIEVRSKTARVVLYCGVESVDLVLEIYLCYVKDLTPPSSPEVALDAEGDRFWNRMRNSQPSVRYNWMVARIVVHNDLLYDAGICNMPTKVLEGDELYDFVEGKIGTQRLPVAAEWEFDDLRSQFESHWPQFSSS